MVVTARALLKITVSSQQFALMGHGSAAEREETLRPTWYVGLMSQAVLYAKIPKKLRIQYCPDFSSKLSLP